MQIKNNQANIFTYKWIFDSLKMICLIGSFYFIADKFSEQQSDLFTSELPNGFGPTMAVVIVLMVFNWYLEGLRWKLSIQVFESIAIKKAVKVVLCGLALNWILPFTSGDLIARISQQDDKYQTTAAAILNRGIMLGLTFGLGLWGMKFIAQEFKFNEWVLLGIIVGLAILSVIYKNSLTRLVTYFQKVNRVFLIKLISLSILRYAIFVFQFFLLFNLFLPALKAHLVIGGIGWIFLLRSVFPLFFGGIGVREASGIIFFEPYVSNLQYVVLPIVLIWIVNTVIPSLLGLFFVWKFRGFTKIQQTQIEVQS